MKMALRVSNDRAMADECVCTGVPGQHAARADRPRICNAIESISRALGGRISMKYAANIAKTTAINFCRIYQRDTIYPSFSLPRSYPHFFEERFACDYLNNTIKT
jgi:hypothetical protein